MSEVRMQQRRLGREGPMVSSLGLGCMGMSEFYGPTDEVESLATIHRALDLGIDFLDTADVYGPYTNEQLVGQAIAGRRDQVVLATKFGIVRGSDPQARGVNGRPEYVRACCEASLKRLGVDHIDVLPAPRGSQGPYRRHRRRAGRAGVAREGALHRPLGSGAGDAAPRPRG